MVYANIASNNFKEQAEAIVEAMHKAGKTRLAWFSTLSIYDEVPGKFGQWNNATLVDCLPTYNNATKVFENSNLDYTIIRPLI